MAIKGAMLVPVARSLQLTHRTLFTFSYVLDIIASVNVYYVPNTHPNMLSL